MNEDFKKGQRLTASWVDNVNKQLRKVSQMSGSGGIRIAHNPGGISVGYTGSPGTPTALLQTTSGPSPTAYPDPDTRPWDKRVYYCFKLATGVFTETVGFRITSGGAITFDATNVYVCNLGSSFIPQGTQVIAVERSGQWFCNYSNPGPDIVEGLLTTSLASNGTATLQVYSELGAGWHAVSGYTVSVKDRSGYNAPSGVYCMAVKNVPYGNTYRVIDIGCSP